MKAAPRCKTEAAPRSVNVQLEEEVKARKADVPWVSLPWKELRDKRIFAEQGLHRAAEATALQVLRELQMKCDVTELPVDIQCRDRAIRVVATKSLTKGDLVLPPVISRNMKLYEDKSDSPLALEVTVQEPKGTTDQDMSHVAHMLSAPAPTTPPELIPMLTQTAAAAGVAEQVHGEHNSVPKTEDSLGPTSIDYSKLSNLEASVALIGGVGSDSDSCISGATQAFGDQTATASEANDVPQEGVYKKGDSIVHKDSGVVYTVFSTKDGDVQVGRFSQPEPDDGISGKWDNYKLTAEDVATNYEHRPMPRPTAPPTAAAACAQTSPLSFSTRCPRGTPVTDGDAKATRRIASPSTSQHRGTKGELRWSKKLYMISELIPPKRSETTADG